MKAMQTEVKDLTSGDIRRRSKRLIKAPKYFTSFLIWISKRYAGSIWYAPYYDLTNGVNGNFDQELLEEFYQ